MQLASEAKVMETPEEKKLKRLKIVADKLRAAADAHHKYEECLGHKDENWPEFYAASFLGIPIADPICKDASGEVIPPVFSRTVEVVDRAEPIADPVPGFFDPAPIVRENALDPIWPSAGEGTDTHPSIARAAQG